MSLLESLLGKQQRELDKVEKTKSVLLEDPKKLDDYVGKVFQGVSPSKKIAPSKKTAFLTDRVNAVIPDGHPMKDFGQELKANLAEELANPENQGYSSKEITSGIVKSMLEEQDPETGMTRLEKGYQEQRLNETSRSFIPFFSGEDKSLKAPLGLPGMMKYEDWRKERFAREQAVTAEEYNDYPGAIVKAASTAGGISGTAALIAGQMGPQIALPEEVITAPLATAVGAIAGAAGEAIAYPLRKMFKNTEWGSARQYSGKLKDTLTMGALDIGIDAATLTPVEMKFLKSFKMSADLKSLAVAKPTVQNVIKADTADKVVLEEGKKAAKAAWKGKKKSIVVEKTAPEVAEKELDTLSETGKVQALTHPDGIEKGVAVVKEEEDVMKWISGEKTADAEAKITKEVRNKKKKKGSSTPALEEVSKTLGEEWSGRGVPRRVGGGDEGLAVGMREDGGTPAASFDSTGVPVRAGGGDEVLGKEMKYAEEVGTTPPPEIISANVKEITASPTVQKAFASLERESQAEVLAKAPERKSIDEVVDYFGEGTVSAAGKETVGTKVDPVVNKLYKDMEVYQDNLLKKYYPELKLDAKEDLPKIMDAVTSLSKRVPKEEVKVLDDMVAEFDRLTVPGTLQVAKATKVIEKELPQLDLPGALKKGQEILARKKTEGLTPTDELPLWEDLSMQIQGSAKILPTDKREHLRAVENIITTLKKKGNLLTAFAMFGVGAEVFDWFSPGEAEAGMIDSAGKMISKVAGKGALNESKELLMSAMKENQHIVDKIVSPDVYHITDTMWQKGLADSAAGGPSQVLRNLSNFMATGKVSLRRSLMSPGQALNEILNIKEGVMNNPAVFKASYMMAETTNIENGIKIMGNILKASGVPQAVKEVSKAFEPLAPLMKDQVGFDYYTKRTDDLVGQLKKLYGKKVQTVATVNDINSTKQQLAIARKNIVKFKPGMEKYHQEWEKTAQAAAQQHSSVRVFLAADDDMVKWSKYPFMKDIPLSKAEQFAAGRIKRQMGGYKTRLEENGIETKSGAYMHYTLHPKVNASMMEELTGDIASAPYLKNYSRSLNSRPLMPDVYASMGHYIPDTERRLQNQAFWNSGWRKVANKTRFIEPLKQAFDALEKGTAPVERSFGNNMARWYTNFEVYKRLFLSPSAGLKHLVKLTGDMATLGVGATAGALPEAVKGVTWRVVENTPFLKDVAQKYFKTDMTSFDKLKKSLFDSIVPVQNTRYRMSQMGFDDYDSYFTKLGKAADQVNHAGGVWINLAELVDRGVSVHAGLNLAAKKGMTSEQALYGIYDTVLKNNFLGREFSPQWLRNPKVKALLSFQTTPFKIFERRVMTGIKAGRAVENMGKEIRQATRTAEGRQQVLLDLRNLWKDMKTTEREMKSNIFLDSIRSEQDFFGNSAVKQFAKDILITGAGTMAGGAVGANLFHHFFHLPFVSSAGNKNESADFPLAVSPGVHAASKGWQDWKNKDDDDDEFLTTKVIKSWLGNSGPFPDIVNKLNRISQSDIPEIYQDSKFKYLFSIPGKEEK